LTAIAAQLEQYATSNPADADEEQDEE